MKFKKTLSAAILAATTMASTSAMAELSANISVTSDYIWRGITQTDSGPAIQGGLDYGHESGVYIGTWASNVDEGVEIDLYAGYAGEIGEFGYDLGYLTYNYTDDAFSENFGEFYISGSFKMFSVLYAIGDYDGTDYTYLDVSAEFDLKDIATLGLHYGMTDIDAAEADYDDYSVTLSKSFEEFDVSLGYFKEDAGDEDAVVATIGTSFDL